MLDCTKWRHWEKRNARGPLQNQKLERRSLPQAMVHTSGHCELSLTFHTLILFFEWEVVLTRFLKYYRPLLMMPSVGLQRYQWIVVAVLPPSVYLVKGRSNPLLKNVLKPFLYLTTFSLLCGRKSSSRHEVTYTSSSNLLFTLTTKFFLSEIGYFNAFWSSISLIKSESQTFSINPQNKPSISLCRQCNKYFRWNTLACD